MAIVVTPESELGKEMAKWERPWRVQEFPKMLYRAQKDRSGKVYSMKPEPSPWGWTDPAQYMQAQDETAAFNRACQRIVTSEDEERVAKNDGWRVTQNEALEAFEAREQAIGNAAAEAAYQARQMSEKAQRELAEASDATHEHVTDVTAKSKKQLRDEARA